MQDEFYNNVLPNVITAIKEILRWKGCMALTGKVGRESDVWVSNLKGPLKVQSRSEKIVLVLILRYNV
jgi:hypothetical protein